MERLYTERHAREILEPCGLDRYFILDERGVWPKVERDVTMQAETELLRWRPARALKMHDVSLDIADTPMLPFPFNSRELAAFMLEGVGALIADFYGEWDDGPDLDSLNQIDPDSMARTALVQAFAAYREAKSATTTEPGDQPDTDAMVRHLLKLAPAQTPVTAVPVDAETKEQRQDRRLKACEAAGLVMPKKSIGRFPYGVGDVAKREGVTRQALTEDVKAALQRRESAKMEGVIVRF